MKLSFEDIVRVTGGDVVGTSLSQQAFTIATDTRTLQAGDAFVALEGERFDGHVFVANAFERGAGLAIVNRETRIPEGRTGVVVGNTLLAYMQLAGEVRMRTGATVVAITGSTGKTTTKALLAQMLQISGSNVVATPENENNEVGVSKLLLGLEGTEQHVIIEMGARHPRDIEKLVGIAKPAMGILTNIGEAHLEIFGSREALAETKWGLFSGDTIAILNVLDQESLARAPSLRYKPGWFGAGPESMQAKLAPASLIPSRNELAFFDGVDHEMYPIRATLPGEHNLANLAAAVTGARALELSPQQIIDAIPQLTLPPGRYEKVGLSSGVQVVYDAYNASLSGTVATLRSFAAERAERRIAVLGGMAELGEDAPLFHEQAGAAVRGCGIDMLLAGGAHAQDMMRGALQAGMPPDAIMPYHDNATAVQLLKKNLRAGDSVLLKGSRMYKMEQILEGLR